MALLWAHPGTGRERPMQCDDPNKVHENPITSGFEVGPRIFADFNLLRRNVGGRNRIESNT